MPPAATASKAAMSSSRSRMPPSALPLTPAAAALGRVHHSTPAHLVVGVHQRAQVGEDVLHLAPVVELHAADDAVGHAGAHEGLLDHAALRVGPVEDGDVAEAVMLGVDETADLVH